MDNASQIKKLADAIDRIKRDLDGTRAHVLTPESRDFVYIKVSKAAKELDDVSRKLRRIAFA